MVPIADTAARLFYERLFEIDPTTRPLFKSRSSRTRTPAYGYGVTETHYRSVGDALLWTLEQGLGQSWTTETKAAWSEAYGLLSGVMQRACARVAAA